ncbi:MAG: YopX family protein [Oenococcus sicerae]
MTREIKFRVWNKDTKKFNFIELTDYMSGTGLMDDWVDSENSIWEQFTGLKDSKGQEIYEGDIVKAESITPEGLTDSKNGFVEFLDGCFVYEDQVTISRLCDTVGIPTVVGNIHEPLPESPADWVKRHEQH